MPPKTTKIQDIRKKIQKDKTKLKKNIEEGAPPKRPSKVVVNKMPEQNLKFELQNRDFFTNVIEKYETASEIQEEMMKYSNKNPRVEAVFEKIIDEIPSDFFMDFITKYTKQSEKNLNDFYEDYVNKKKIKTIIREKKHEEWEETLLHQRRDKDMDSFFDNLELDEEEEEVEEPVKSVKCKRPIKVVDFDIKPKLRDVISRKKDIYINDNCVQMVKKAPWLNSRVTGIFIRSDISDISPYIISGDFCDIMEIDGVDWRRVNGKFFELICGENAKRRSYNGSVLNTFDRENNSVTIQLAYNTINGFIVQNEEFFKLEKEYLSKVGDDTSKKINKLMNESVSKEVKEVGMLFLTTKFSEIEFKGDYIAYSNNVIEAIAKGSNDVKQFFDKLADLLVYLSPIIKPDRIFIERLKNNYYIADVLGDLPPQEKLPEVYDDVRVDDRIKNNITEFIRLKREEIFTSLLYSILNMRQDPSLKALNVKTQQIPVYQQVDLPVWKNICVNYEDVRDMSDKELIHYREGDEIYCFSISSLLDRFDSYNYYNPYTMEKFSDDFVKKLTTLFDPIFMDSNYAFENEDEETSSPKSASRSRVQTEFVIPALSPSKNIRAPRFLEIVIENITSLESKLSKGIYGQSEDVYSYASDFSDSFFDIEEEIKQKLKEKRTPDLVVTDEEIKQKIKEKRTPDLVVTDEEICKYCNKNFRDPDLSLKSIIEHGDGGKVVKFCNFKCFEKHDSWPKRKK